MQPQHLLIASCVLALSGCATAPDKIQPSAVNASAYAALTCGGLEAEKTRTSAALRSLEHAQRRARAVDTIGVALVFVPVSSLLGGNHKREIADRKGQLAVMDAQSNARCRHTEAAFGGRNDLVELTKRASVDPSPQP